MARYTISDVARLAGVSRDTVKKCERLGLVASVRDRNGWRCFGPEAVRTLCDLYRRNELQRVEENEVA